MNIHNSIIDIQKSLMDIHNSFMDIIQLLTNEALDMM